MKTAENVQRSTRLRKATARQASNVQRSKAEKIHRTFEKFVVPSYTRFDLVLERGEGSYVWDVDGKRYLDLAGGIAVCSLGHAHPEITKALTDQSKKLIHVSNLYYTKPQGKLASPLFPYAWPFRAFVISGWAWPNEQ